MKDVRPLFELHNRQPFESVAAVFGLQHSEDFDDLDELLFNYSCRDQEGEPEDVIPDTLGVRRAVGYRLAKEMRDNAAIMLASLDAIYLARKAFNDEVVKWHPPLIEAVLDVDLGDPGIIFLPETIEILQSFFSGEINWDALDAKLAKMAALPVRDNLERGPVANTTLRAAVKACRTYWRDIEGKSWSMSALKNVATRTENVRDYLQGECEIFVACMIERGTIRFDLQGLSSAWLAVDKKG